MIEPFLQPDVLEGIVREFPEFDTRYAANETGQIGLKAARPDLPDLGTAYRHFDRLLQSNAFLRLIEEITGIPSPLYDPDYVGGGTHENLSEQELDPHVDFNYHPTRGWHRRLNLILFLNPEWEASWGGCLDLHSDPWAPERDEVVSIIPVTNRAVLFETTETSWHGFRKIVTPPGRQSLSRKSVAVYFYTKERSADETAASHATVYVPRPFPKRFRAGEVLQQADVEELRTLYDRRDQQIRFLYEREQEYMGVLHEVLHSPTFRLAAGLAWPFRAVKRVFGKGK